jgi:hypothetical protein
MIICWHGTNYRSAMSIIKNGFRPDTHFAAHAEDALGFGGPYLFSVQFDREPKGWQFMNTDHIPPDRIVNLTVFDSCTLYGPPMFDFKHIARMQRAMRKAVREANTPRR